MKARRWRALLFLREIFAAAASSKIEIENREA
jgi:hypothetical protein